MLRVLALSAGAGVRDGLEALQARVQKLEEEVARVNAGAPGRCGFLPPTVAAADLPVAFDGEELDEAPDACRVAVHRRGAPVSTGYAERYL